MLKVKRMAVLAVVALGLVALAAPAGASAKSSKSIERLNKDVQRLGNNVSELRKKTDEMNNTIASLAKVAGDSLTKLQAGLVTLSETTADFKYGVVQVSNSGIAGVGPSHFYATPPIYKTGEQSTVTFGVPAGLGTSGLKLFTAVRSVNPNSGTVGCRVTANIGATHIWQTLKQGTTDGIFINMPQSDITPKNGSKAYPYSLVDTEDNVLNLADAQYGVDVVLPSTITRQPIITNPSVAGGNALVGSPITEVTLSCLRTS